MFYNVENGSFHSKMYLKYFEAEISLKKTRDSKLPKFFLVSEFLTLLKPFRIYSKDLNDIKYLTNGQEVCPSQKKLPHTRHALRK